MDINDFEFLAENEDILNKLCKITSGHYKGYIGQIIDINDNNVTLSLDSYGGYYKKNIKYIKLDINSVKILENEYNLPNKNMLDEKIYKELLKENLKKNKNLIGNCNITLLEKGDYDLYKYVKYLYDIINNVSTFKIYSNNKSKKSDYFNILYKLSINLYNNFMLFNSEKLKAENDSKKFIKNKLNIINKNNSNKNNSKEIFKLKILKKKLKILIQNNKDSLIHQECNNWENTLFDKQLYNENSNFMVFSNTSNIYQKMNKQKLNSNNNKKIKRKINLDKILNNCSNKIQNYFFLKK